MPVKKEREYRTLVAPLAAQSSGEKRLQSECYVEGYERTALRRELPQAERNRRYAGRTDRRGKDQKIAGYGAAAYLQPLAALIAGGNWNNGANCGARAVNCNNYPWNVNTNIGARGACDLVRTLQAQSSTEYWQGLRKG